MNIAGTLRRASALYRREGVGGFLYRLRTRFGRRSMVRLADGKWVYRNDYLEWVRRYDSLAAEGRRLISRRIAQLSKAPMISVVMPVYNPNIIWLDEAINSIRKQLYANWELCIADDASSDPDVRKVLERHAHEDPRIKVMFREHNGHISAASNSALALATAEWVAFLDHDDILAEHALYCVADHICADPAARLIYSDEDVISESGVRMHPYFKPNWNRSLFYSHNMICHLAVYYRPILDEIGGFRTGLEGAQDYDLALRFIERINESQIHHIPHILYHWRVHSKSTAGGSHIKPYAMLAGERALNDHFRRGGIAGRAERTEYGYRVHYQLPERLPLVSLIIPTRNGLAILKKCVGSICDRTSYPNFEIIIVDNGSDDPAIHEYFSSLAADRRIRVLHDDRPFNYSALNNMAVKHAYGEYLALLNNDIEVISPDWLSEMVSLAMQPQAGAVGARLWYPDNSLQHGGCITGIGNDAVAGHSHKGTPAGHAGYYARAQRIQELSAVTAACLVIRKSIYQEVGGLDEVNLKVAFNDIDFCLRVREAGYRNVWTPYAELYHHESLTRGYEDTPAKKFRYQEEVAYMHRRWGHKLLDDPAYNPNLSLEGESVTFTLAWPPRAVPCWV